jgi:3',5'-cyclic-nucleotide phosphodiesterase
VDDTLAIDAGALTSALELPDQHRVEAVLVSHAHMDHVRDLATIADNRCQQGGPPLEIVGLKSTLDVLRAHFFNDLLWPDFSKIPAGTQGMTITYREVEAEQTVTVAGKQITPVHVTHTIDTAAFIVADAKKTIAYSGDTGPTERFWEVLAERPRLDALLMEVSFPNDNAALARVSGHHTPQSLDLEMNKLNRAEDVPTLLYHIKPFFQREVERELARVRKWSLAVCALEQEFEF